MSLGEVKEFLSITKDVATLSAVLAAFGYFIYKLVAGWLLLNLSLMVTTERQSMHDEKDHLVVTVELAKGKIDAVRLLRVQLRLVAIDPTEEPPLVRDVQGIYRLAIDDTHAVAWDNIHSSKTYLNVSPDETLTVAEHFRVSPGTTYKIEVVAIGDRFRDRVIPSLSEWRTSKIVLPVIGKEPNAA